MTAFITSPKDSEQALSTECGPLVLVVEDHEDTRFLLTYYLDVHNCRVVVAKDGMEAVTMAEAIRPDLILMDISLPRMDGLEATRKMRAVAELRGVPVIFLSGHADASFRAHALATGGNDYLIKPFALKDLESILERHIGHRGNAGAH